MKKYILLLTLLPLSELQAAAAPAAPRAKTEQIATPMIAAPMGVENARRNTPPAGVIPAAAPKGKAGAPKAERPMAVAALKVGTVPAKVVSTAAIAPAGAPR